MTLKTFLYWSILVQDRLLYKSFVLSATAFELCSIAEPDTTDTKSRSHKLPFLSTRLFRFLQPHAWICSFAIYSNYSMLCNAVLIDRLPRAGRFRFQPYCCLRQIVKLRKLFFLWTWPFSTYTRDRRKQRETERERERERESELCRQTTLTHIRRRSQRPTKLVRKTRYCCWPGTFGQVSHVEKERRNAGRQRERKAVGKLMAFGHELEFDGLIGWTNWNRYINQGLVSWEKANTFICQLFLKATQMFPEHSTIWRYIKLSFMQCVVQTCRLFLHNRLRSSSS